MQTIPSTFRHYALPGHTDILDPVDNIVAGGPVRDRTVRLGVQVRGGEAWVSGPATVGTDAQLPDLRICGGRSDGWQASRREGAAPARRGAGREASDAWTEAGQRRHTLAR